MHQLLELAMPTMERERKKEKTSTIAETKGGGKMFIPVTRKHKIRYPKNYDPENPGKLPEPERWLPKWQRRRKGRKYQAKGS
jgi:hypothetical protein